MSRRRHFTPGRAAPSRAAGAGLAHTWFVRVTRTMLPLAALGIVAFTISRAQHDQNTPEPLVSVPEKAAPGRMDLVAPRYEGKDQQGRPYTVTADRARRVMGQDEALALDNPKGDITLEDGAWLEAQAPQGLYNRATAHLYLSGGVSFYHDKGYELHTSDLTVDLKTRHARTELPADGHGPAGRIQGQTLDISDGGQLIVFGGPAKLTLWNLSGAKKDDPG